MGCSGCLCDLKERYERLFCAFFCIWRYFDPLKLCMLSVFDLSLRINNRKNYETNKQYPLRRCKRPREASL